MIKISTNYKETLKEARQFKAELEKVVKFFNKEPDIALRISYDEKFDTYCATITTNFAKKPLTASSSKKESSVSAVGEACDILIRQIRKEKTRKYEKSNNKSLYEVASENTTTESEKATMENFEEYGMNSDRVTKTKEIWVEPVTVDEAIDQMESKGKDFFVFYDLEGNVNVVYKRHNNKGYGLLRG